MKLSHCLAGVLVVAMGLASSHSAAQVAAGLTIEQFFQQAQFQDMVLSPDGKHLAASTPHNGRENLVIVNLQQRTNKVITEFKTIDAIGASWVSNDRLCFSSADGQEASGRPRYRGTFCIDIDGNNMREFTKTGLTILRLVPNEPGVVIAAQRGRAYNSLDLFKVDTRTGKADLITFETPGRVSNWVLDRNGVPRVATRVEEGSAAGVSLWMRRSENDKFEKVATYLPDEPSVSAIAFDWEGTLYVSSNLGRDRRALYKWDWDAKKPGELIAEDELVDINGGLLFSERKKKLVGLSYQGAEPVQKWFDEDMRATQRTVDGTLKDTYNYLSSPRDHDRLMLVTSLSGSEPTKYALLDREKKALEPLVSSRPWIKPELMPTRQYIQYKARDGRVIPAYLVLPRGVEPKNLPLVINIHGGPQVRGYNMLSGWGRWPEAVFLAAHGYAVLEPDPRHSTGFGLDHYRSGFKQWGLAMQDDITDGALRLASKGIIDINRVCLHGGSYGGYATLQGLVKEPDLFKCGNSFVAVTDLPTMQNYAGSDISRGSDYLETVFTKRVGDSSRDKEQFTKTSPAQNADKIKARVLLTMGSEDLRVPLKHGDIMVSAMEKAGVKHEYRVYKDEGHGYNRPENVADFYRRALKLFNESIGSGKVSMTEKVIDNSVPSTK
jgi:dipeptidyl aminopeptidase/acylaminoacyl peptidase